MSGGGFMNRAEASRLNARGIDDRATVVGDLQALVKARGLDGLAAALGLIPDAIAGVIDRTIAVQAGLLDALYGARGRKLRAGLGVDSGNVGTCVDAGVAAVVAALARRAPDLALPSATGFSRSEGAGKEARVLEAAGFSRDEMVAILRRAKDALGTWSAVGAAMGLGTVLVGNLAGGHCDFTERTIGAVLEWAVAPQVHAVADLAPAGSGAAEALPAPAVLPAAAPAHEREELQDSAVGEGSSPPEPVVADVAEEGAGSPPGLPPRINSSCDWDAPPTLADALGADDRIAGLVDRLGDELQARAAHLLGEINRHFGDVRRINEEIEILQRQRASAQAGIAALAGLAA